MIALQLKLVPLRRHRFCGQKINGQEMIIKEYPVRFPKSMTLGYGETYKAVEVSVDVTWDERKTVLNQAVLAFSAHSFRGLLSVRRMEARLYVNEQVVMARGWAGDFGCVTQTGETNIGGYLVNGSNKFRLELVGSWELNTSGIDAIYIAFEAWFTGEPPTVKPTEPEWVTYLKWGAVALGILGAVYVGIRVYEARKKK